MYTGVGQGYGGMKYEKIVGNLDLQPINWMIHRYKGNPSIVPRYNCVALTGCGAEDGGGGALGVKVALY